jgi:heat shock protein HtpX
MISRLTSFLSGKPSPGIRNIFHSIILIGGIALLATVSAFLLFGWVGVVWTFLGVGALILISPRIAPQAIMRMYQARPIDPESGARVTKLVKALAHRAGLSRVPSVFVIPSHMVNAFAVGSRDSATIALTTGMLARLDTRQLAGVLAHEISHIKNGDLWIMNIADIFSRITLLLSYITFFGVILSFMAGISLPIIPVLLLLSAPTISTLLQLALSRSREFDADLGGARLSGNPEWLASALSLLERTQGRMWERVAVPGRGVPAPSILRTHPDTEERVRRLLSMDRTGLDPGWLTVKTGDVFPALQTAQTRPRYDWRTGLWY